MRGSPGSLRNNTRIALPLIIIIIIVLGGRSWRTARLPARPPASSQRYAGEALLPWHTVCVWLLAWQRAPPPLIIIRNVWRRWWMRICMANYCSGALPIAELHYAAQLSSLSGSDSNYFQERAARNPPGRFARRTIRNSHSHTQQWVNARLALARWSHQVSSERCKLKSCKWPGDFCKSKT